LEKLLDSDEAINSLFYRLLNDIQIYVAQTLSSDEIKYPQGKTEFISREAWDSIIRETTISIPIGYEQFQFELINAFRTHLLEGFSITNTLRQISEHVKNAHSLRPILIIDDLVQSLNIFASDLIDYFITLDEGSWDVVMGLTPAAFEESSRGKNLLDRIAYLDTIDDRVEKFWLSDDNGIDSYIINEQNCHEFASRYLSEFHRINKWNDVTELYPFNRECLVRIYRGLPSGKGKARYFLKYLRNIFEELADGKPIVDAIGKYAHKESVARTSNKDIASICELYGPIISDERKRRITLSQTLLNDFGIDDCDTEVIVEPLFKQSIKREAIVEILDDEEKMAIRDWLLGKPVNRQMLKGVRQGAARWIRMIYPVNLIYRDSISKPHGALRWDRVYLGIRPPIYLEDVDEGEAGISVSRQIGNLAFDLHRYADAKGDEAKSLLAQLASESSMMELLFSAVDYRKEISDQLELQLGMPIEVLALSLYTVLMVSAGTARVVPSSFDNTFLHQVNLMRVKYSDRIRRLDKQIQQSIQFFFEDYFKLRQNIIDGVKISQLSKELGPEELLSLIAQVNEAQIDKDYKLLNANLKKLIFEVTEEINRWRSAEDQPKFLSGPAENILDRLQKAGLRGLPMSEAPIEVWSEILKSGPGTYEHLRVYMDELNT
jgi:hypothetical protein